MSLSDCEKCWDTPCRCGWDYRNWSRAQLSDLRDQLQGLLDGTHKYSQNKPTTRPKNKEAGN